MKDWQTYEYPDVTHPNPDLCICKGNGYYYVAMAPPISFDPVDKLQAPMKIEHIKEPCKHHYSPYYTKEGKLYYGNGCTCYACQTSAKFKQANATKPHLSYNKPYPTKLKVKTEVDTSKITYPEGLPPDEFVAWCAQKNVPTPDWFNMTTKVPTSELGGGYFTFDSAELGKMLEILDKCSTSNPFYGKDTE